MKKNTLKQLLLYLAFVPLTLTLACKNSSNPGNNVPDVPWESLFNGKDLTGWNQKNGDADYMVKDSTIIGVSKLGTPNSFLCTDKLYSDFILEVEFKVEGGLNSGIQIRSNSFPDHMDGRVHGYQVEIDPSDRAWSGGIFDEARRGWLYPLDWNQEARRAFKANDWNKYRVEAIGNHIKTWVNGTPAANLFDEETSEGFIALQVHSIHDSALDGTKIMWKNIRIITKDVEKYETESTAPELNRLVNQLTSKQKEEGWELLFDGASVEKWRGAHKEQFPEKGWVVENGTITVLSSDGAESKNGGDIVTKEEYAAFDLRLEFMITEGANSGIKYFVTEKEETEGSAFGLEYQILDDKNHPDAEKYTTYEQSRTVASLYDMIPAENKRFSGPGKWAHARLVVYPDNKVQHWLNGIKVVEYQRGSEAFKERVANSKYAKDSYNEFGPFGEAEKGHILLQDHGDRVSFRSIKIKNLKTEK